MTEDQKKDYLLKLLRNVIELCAEAELLHRHGHDKRACFLVITALEELLKYFLYLDSDFKAKNLHFHKEKFKPIYNFFQKVLSSDKINEVYANIEDSIPDDKKYLIPVIKTVFTDFFFGFSDLGTIRKSLLYVDLPTIEQKPYADYSEMILLMIPPLRDAANKMIATINSLEEKV